METQVEKDELTVTERDDKSLRIERSEEQEASGGAFLFKAPRKKRQRKVTADVVTKKKANYTDDGSSVSDSAQPEKIRESTPWSVSIACKDPEESSEFDSEEEGSQTDCSLTAEPPCTEAGYSVGSIKTFLELTKVLTTVACFGQETVLTVVSCSRQYEALPKPALNLTPAGEILEGDTVTLSCSVQPYSISWRYLWYKGRQYSTPVYQTDSSSGTGAGYTISAAALSHSGEYWCRAGRGRNTFYSEHSDPIWVNVTGE
ncbi:UNVERIFIED_CONTAM: hypothetical protein FKN15_071128 [Acipenser sinensis]